MLSQISDTYATLHCCLKNPKLTTLRLSTYDMFHCAISTQNAVSFNPSISYHLQPHFRMYQRNGVPSIMVYVRVWRRASRWLSPRSHTLHNNPCGRSDKETFLCHAEICMPHRCTRWGLSQTLHASVTTTVHQPAAVREIAIHQQLLSESYDETPSVYQPHQKTPVFDVEDCVHWGVLECLVFGI